MERERDRERERERERESIRKHIDSSRLDAMDRKYVRRIDARTKLIEMEQNVIG